MANERFFVDGWEISNQPNMAVEYLSGLDGTPPLLGTNPRVPNRSGEIWRRKYHGAGSFDLALWWGAETGRQAALLAYDTFLRAAVRPHRLPTWTRFMPDGSVRFCGGEVTGAIRPTAVGRRGLRAIVTVDVPGAYWHSQTIYTNSVTGAAPRDLELTQFKESTAPMTQLTYRIDGPIINAVVMDVGDGYDGDYFTYAGGIAAGQSLIVNAAAWTVTGAGGLVPNQQAFLASGPHMLAVPASLPGASPRLQLRGTATTSATKLTVTGPRAFLS